MVWSGSGASLGTASVNASGTATVTVTVPQDAEAHSVIELTATESGTLVRVPITVTVPVPPTTEPVAAAKKALTKALKGAIDTDAATHAAGATITVNVGVQHVGEFVSVSLQSKSVENLGGWLLVNAEGKVSTTLPADIPAGKYKLVVQDATGAVIGWTEITVEKAPRGR